MQETKDNNRVGECESPGDDTAPDNSSALGAGKPVDDQADADGWHQYRRWISKAPSPRARRASIDPSLYTWKGYRNWTEQVKRNWPDG